jgi:hypothetical protein
MLGRRSFLAGSSLLFGCTRREPVVESRPSAPVAVPNARVIVPPPTFALFDAYPALAKTPGEAYPLSEMLADVRAGVWTELGRSPVTIDPFRRELQRSWFNLARAKLNPTPVQLPPGAPPQLAQLFGPARATSDVRSLFRSELRAVQQSAQAAIPRATNRETRAHLEDMRDQINQLLNPR